MQSPHETGGKELRDAVVESQAALLDESEDRCSGERLRVAREPERGVRPQRLAAVTVGVAGNARPAVPASGLDVREYAGRFRRLVQERPQEPVEHLHVELGHAQIRPGMGVAATAGSKATSSSRGSIGRVT